MLDAEYFRRIDALNFTMVHDDGQLPDDLEDADIVLVGITRTSKTPTSIYLANRGIKTANMPIVPGVPVPASLLERQAAADRRPGRDAPSASRRSARTACSASIAGFDVETYVDRATIAEEISLRAAALRPPRLADDRRDAPLDRGDGGRDRCAARQDALSRRAIQAKAL